MNPMESEASLLTVLIVLAFGLLINLPAYWVFRKAGWSGWWFALLAVPLAGVILLYVFAFKEWPVEKAAKNLGDPV